MLLVTSIDRPNLSLSKDKQNGRLICLEAGAPFQRRIEHGAKGLEEGTHLSWSSPFSDYGMERVTLFTGKSSVTYRSSNSPQRVQVVILLVLTAPHEAAVLPLKGSASFCM